MKRITPGNMGLQLSRLERAPDKREVGGSSPLEPITKQPKGCRSLQDLEEVQGTVKPDKRKFEGLDAH